MRRLRFENRGVDCVISYVANKTRIGHPVFTLLVYNIQDKARVVAEEAQFLSLSSHCPRALHFAETERYFIAWSPCEQEYLFDETCAPVREELKTRLEQYFARFSRDPAHGTNPKP